jgi:hypothetical protein
MQELGIERDQYRTRITEGHRQAMELSILLKLEADDTEDVHVLAETAEKLDEAVRELERACRVVAPGHSVVFG